MNKANRDSDTGLSQLELMRIVSLTEASRLSGIHAKTLRVNHSDKIIRISKKRLGMRLKDALMIKDAAE